MATKAIQVARHGVTPVHMAIATDRKITASPYRLAVFRFHWLPALQINFRILLA
jgi:hypothetical protein